MFIHLYRGHMAVADLIRESRRLADPARAKSSLWFFKTGPGQYGEGDKFLGLTTPVSRRLARSYKDLPLSDLHRLLQSAYHEHRLIALVILQIKFDLAGKEAKKEIFDFYLSHTDRINNWDLVDISAPKIVGAYLADKPRGILYRLAGSDSLWERRIAAVSCLYFIVRRKDPADALEISRLLLKDKQDLIHKASGWMLREVGKNCGQKYLTEFLDLHVREMPRTMLRYSIERLSPELRRHYLVA